MRRFQAVACAVFLLFHVTTSGFGLTRAARAMPRNPSSQHGDPARGVEPKSGDFPLPDPGDLLESLKIRVDVAKPRVFLYSNKVGSFYAGSSSGPNTDPNQGLNVFGRKLLESYAVSVDGKPLEATRLQLVEVAPYGVQRTYTDGVREQVVLLDGLDALVVQIEAPQGKTAGFNPVFAGSSESTDYTVETTTRGVLVVPKVGGDIQQSTPRAILYGPCGSARFAIEPSAKPQMGYAASTVKTTESSRATFFIAVGANRAAAEQLGARLAAQSDTLIQAKKDRIARLLLDSFVDTDDDDFDKALAWLKVSGDALITDQAGPGIWAGLYWFNNYWGRDTFISLPGLALVTGQFRAAKAILESFSTYQKTDPNDPLFGRIPNRVNSPTDIIYNTADGTPWFVREAYEYTMLSGDRDFAKRIYPAIANATDGALRYRTDKFGFLTHDDADTWMDAKWEGKTPWSPRGDRAVDIQALWYAQLEASERLALLVGDKSAAKRWRLAAARLRASFRSTFRDPKTGVLYDHLNADGSPDRQVRPNQIFALTAPLSTLLSRPEGVPVVRQVVGELTYPYGVASLAQTDENFHPYHHDERWHFDSAYHNGTVWVWNAGPLVSALCSYQRQDFAYELTSAMVHQTLDLGAVGTLSELIDAVPRNGQITLSGTETQAWSIAEFIRVFYQDYLGVSPNVIERSLTIDPRLPTKLGSVRAVLAYGDDRIKLTMTRDATGAYHAVFFAPGLEKSVRVFVPGTREGIVPVGKLDARSPVAMTIAPSPMPIAADLGRLAFVEPRIRPGLRSMTGANNPVPRATAAEMVHREPDGARVILDRTDPEGDDKGDSGQYTYPTDAHFAPGILDLTRVHVTTDGERYYFRLAFRRLADPGWHPELGFQLTYAAIAIDVDDDAGTGTTRVGKSANTTLATGIGFDRFIYIGGGLEIADDRGQTLVVYSPASRDGAIGNATTGEIRFSVPKSYLGDNWQRWRIAIFVGGQDDGGTAGIGVFRAVKTTAEQWAGGGASTDDGSASRIYDESLPD